MIFHHIGYACERIEDQLIHFKSLGYQPEGEIFSDPVQKIRGLFLTLGASRVELLEPLNDDAPIWPYLRKGIKMYHLAYTTQELWPESSRLVAQGALVVVPPQPAIAFGGRKISFLMLRNQLLVELIEA